MGGVSVWVHRRVNRQTRRMTGRRKESFMESRAVAMRRDDKLQQNWLAKHLKDKAITSLQTHTRAESEDRNKGDKERSRYTEIDRKSLS